MNGRLFRIGLMTVALGALGLTGFAGEGRSPLPGRPRVGAAEPEFALVDRALALDRIDGILAGLEDLRRDGAEDGRGARMAGIVMEARRLRRDVETAAIAAPVREAEPVPSPLADREYRAFLGSVKRASFSDDRVALVVDQAEFAWFTSAQAAELTAAIQSWGRVDAAAALFPRVLDPESFHLVYRELTFSSDREELRRRIGKVEERR